MNGCFFSVLYIPALATERRHTRDTLEQGNEKTEPTVCHEAGDKFYFQSAGPPLFFQASDFLVRDRNPQLTAMMVYGKSHHPEAEL